LPAARHDSPSLLPFLQVPLARFHHRCRTPSVISSSRLSIALAPLLAACRGCGKFPVSSSGRSRPRYLSCCPQSLRVSAVRVGVVSPRNLGEPELAGVDLLQGLGRRGGVLPEYLPSLCRVPPRRLHAPRLTPRLQS
jgi:hypothetical protein